MPTPSADPVLLSSPVEGSVPHAVRTTCPPDDTVNAPREQRVLNATVAAHQDEQPPVTPLDGDHTTQAVDVPTRTQEHGGTVEVDKDVAAMDSPSPLTISPEVRDSDVRSAPLARSYQAASPPPMLPYPADFSIARVGTGSSDLVCSNVNTSAAHAQFHHFVSPTGQQISWDSAVRQADLRCPGRAQTRRLERVFPLWLLAYSRFVAYRVSALGFVC